MKITVLLGSPHKEGTTATLAKEFVKGAENKGHSVKTAYCHELRVAPCMGCDGCADGSCVQKDDMAKLLPDIVEADCIAFVTPTYYFGISAQLKAVIDRFYAKNDALMNSGKKACLIAACADTEEETMAGVVENYRLILKYLGWQDAGRVLAFGAGVREDLGEAILKEAYCLGESL